MIESSSFGQMVIDGQSYTSDLLITLSGIKASWWRKTGHRLCLDDLEEVLQEEVEVFVIGTGFSGLMKVEKEVEIFALSKGIELIIEKTEKAARSFNRVSSQKKAIGAFHLTC